MQQIARIYISYIQTYIILHNKIGHIINERESERTSTCAAHALRVEIYHCRKMHISIIYTKESIFPHLLYTQDQCIFITKIMHVEVK